MNYSRYFLALLLLFPFSTNAGATNTLRGIIIDDKGQSLPGAVIEIPDLKTGTVSDIKGNYDFKNLPKGTFVVKVHLINFGTITEAVNIAGETIKDFKLNESVIENREVVITGSSIATDQRKSITPIQSIGLKEIHEDAFSNIIDAVARIPGVSQVTTGPAVSKPVIRGLGYNRIVTLNDGVRQEGQQWGDEHGIEIDDYDVTRVEVLKGPASLAYGSDALAGVINIISDDLLPEGKISGVITTNYQTNNGMAGVNAKIGGNIKGFCWSGYVTEKDAHDYHNVNDGYVFDTRFNNINYGLNVGLNKKWGFSRLSYTSFNEKLGIAEGDRDSATGIFLKYAGTSQQSITNDADNKSYKMSVPYQHINHQKIVWTNQFYLSNESRVAVILAFQQNTRMEFGDVDHPSTPGLSLLLKTVTYDAKYYLPVFEGWQIITGVNGMYQVNQNRGIEFLIPGYSLFDVGAYGIVKKDWDRWSVSGGLRYDFRTISAEGLTINGPDPIKLFSPFTRNFSNGSGSVGTAYSVTGNTILKFNIASGYRAPNIAELSANGVHEGTIRYEYGQQNLKAENSMQADFGLSWSNQHVMVDASVFENYIKDFIFIARLPGAYGNDSVPTVNNVGNYSAFIYQQSDAHLFGGEVSVDVHPHPLDWLHLQNTLSYVNATFVNGKDSTRYVPFIPPFKWFIELRAQRKTLGKHIRNAYAKVGIDINSTQKNVYTAYRTETPTEGYTLLNAGIGSDIINKKHQPVFTLTIAANNLTDVAYQSPLSRLKYAPENLLTGRMGIYNEGRNISIILAIPLSFN